MADIFKLIKGMSSTERPSKSSSKRDSEPFEKKERISLDNFVIGEEEKRVQAKKTRSNIKDDFLDEEIGLDQQRNEPLKGIEKIDFIALNRESEKKQNLILKREYLTLLDKLEEMSSSYGSLNKSSSDMNIELHQARKEKNKIKEIIRVIGGLLPEGIELKRTLDNMNWNVEDIEKELLEKIQFMVNRAKNADDYIEEQMKKVNQENKNLKRLILHMESEKTRLEQEVEDLKRGGYTAQPAEEISTSISEDDIPEIEEPTVDPEVVRQQQELEEMEKALAEKKRLLEQSTQPSTPPPTPTPTPEPTFDYTFDDEEEETEEESIDTHMLLDVERHIQILPEARKYIIEVIGKTGISRNQELREFLENDEVGKQHFQKGSKFNYTDMSAATKGLKDSGYLVAEKVNLGSKGGYNFQVFELSDIGKGIYKVLTKKSPATPEKKTIMAQHKSLEHGYLIKDCATEFKDMGYTVLTERKDLRFDLPGGKRKDFDLIIEKDGEKAFIEVERGTHTDEDFFNAMDKIYQVMQNLDLSPAQFHFVSPNEQTLFGKTKRQFFLWIKQRLGGIDEVKGKIVVNFTTFDKIKKRQKNTWETINL